VKIRILLVDDHRVLRDGLRSILSSEKGMEVVGEAEDGRQAVKLTRDLAPDVVIMDIGMRELNGVEATRLVRAENPRVRVLALSTYSDKRYVLGMLEAGASGYVLKAAAYDELRRAVQVVFRGKNYLSPDIASVLIDAHLQTPPPSSSGQAVLGGREREVVQLLSEGHTSPEIARRLHVSVSTVETHRRNIMRKLDVHSIAELTRYAIREGLTPLD
jgi:two-component system NarL family response regulator